MNHKEKVKLARSLMTKEEIKAHVSIWNSKAWELRKQAIKNRIVKRIAEIKRKKAIL